MVGLVLEGGGSRGSYQIGACKALKELGVEIGAVTGTSIGALNGAMIVQGQLERAYELWYNITPEQVFDIEEARLQELRKLEISHDGLLYFMKKAREIAQDKGLDITFIKKLLQENIDEQRLRASRIPFGFVTISLSDLKPLELFLEDIPEGKVAEYILASANLPAFKQEKIDGKRYMDGGFYDNLPLNMLVAKGYKDIIAIRTKALGRTRKIAKRSVRVSYLASDDDLGSILDFGQNQARFNLNLGYYDAHRLIQKLKGRKYYVTPRGDEQFFLNFMLAPGEKNILRLGKILGLEGIPYRRMLFEHIIPKFALLLGLEKDSTYEELVIAILEYIALEHQVERFKIYEIDELLLEIKQSLQGGRILKEEEHLQLPAFIKQNDVLSRAVKDRVVREMIAVLFGKAFSD